MGFCAFCARLFRLGSVPDAATGTELRAFITESLIEISQGIHDANDKLIADGLTKERNYLLQHGGNPSAGTGIEFDVAVTTQRTTDASAKIQVAQAGFGVKGSLSRESISRIKFLVHVKNWTG